MATTAILVPPRVPLDRRPAFQLAVGVGGALLTGLSCWALARLALGIAPAMPHLRQPALIIHLATAIPAVPLGAYVLLARKGGARHRLLGKLWLALMLVTAIAALFLRQVNHGQLSWIHAFVLLNLVSVPRVYLSARRGDLAKHRAIIAWFYIGSGLLAGFAAFLPHRTMWWMAFG